jgi:hypothetical protein
MIEVEDKESSDGRARLIALAVASRSAPISFNRQELNEILEVYGRKVADGEWRDYAIDQSGERAVFSIFRRTSELPVYRIVKHPRQPRRQEAYSVVAATGLIVKRGGDLAGVLRAIDPHLHVVAGTG